MIEFANSADAPAPGSFSCATRAAGLVFACIAPGSDAALSR
jgi:hypothetical protein